MPRSGSRSRRWRSPSTLATLALSAERLVRCLREGWNGKGGGSLYWEIEETREQETLNLDWTGLAGNLESLGRLDLLDCWINLEFAWTESVTSLGRTWRLLSTSVSDLNVQPLPVEFPQPHGAPSLSFPAPSPTQNSNNLTHDQFCTFIGLREAHERWHLGVQGLQKGLGRRRVDRFVSFSLLPLSFPFKKRLTLPLNAHSTTAAATVRSTIRRLRELAEI